MSFESDISGISCNNCNGACCQNGPIELNPREAEYLRERGTDLEKMKHQRGEPRPVRGRDFYLMVGRCGNLGADNSCMDYENRPSVCREFKEASYGCQERRKTQELQGNLVPLPTPVLRADFI